MHFFWSARPAQSVSGGGGDGGGGDGGSDGGSGPHSLQVFLHFRFFSGRYLRHFFLLHVTPSLSAHAGELGGGDGSSNSDGGSDGDDGGEQAPETHPDP